MKKVIALACLLTLTGVMAQAQVQQGYVRTISRPNAPSIHLSNATVRVKTPKSIPNAVISNSQGRFSIVMNDMTDGDPFTVTHVSKQGYEWKGKEDGSSRKIFSTKAPMEIVMVSKAQLEADQKKIADKAWAKADKVHHARQAELDKQLKQKTITEEKHRKAMEQLGVNYDRYTGLIDRMADYYARIDYQSLNETDQKIASLIEKGKLEEAQQLLDGVLDVDHVVAQQRSEEALLAEQKQLEAKLSQANREMAEQVESNRETRASRLYMRHTTALGLLNFEEAAKCIKERAELDTLNYDWQFKAAKFLASCMADNQGALDYYERALTLAEEQYGEVSEETSVCYTNIGAVFLQAKSYQAALKYTKIGTEMTKQLWGADDAKMTECYANMALIYIEMDSLDQAEDLCKEAIRIARESNDIDLLRNAYNITGSLYYTKDSKELRQSKRDASLYYWNRAIEYTTKELELARQNNNQDNLATALNNMGSVYVTEEPEKSLQYFQEAMTIKKRLFPKEHPSMAIAYSNMATAYAQMGDFKKAKENYEKSIGIYSKVYGPLSQQAILPYNVMGIKYRQRGIHGEAIPYLRKYLQKALEAGEDPNDIALIVAMMNTTESYSQLMKEDHSTKLRREFEEFMADKAFVAHVMEGTAAEQVGMKGDYYYLAFEDWNIETPRPIYAVFEEYTGRPKTILFEQNGNIEQHRFEDKVGVISQVHLIGRERKAQLIQRYREHK